MTGIIGGNWKMNGLQKDTVTLRSIAKSLQESTTKIILFLPATLLAPAVEIAKSTPLLIGAQDCHMAECGAFTGDIAASQIAELGATYCLLGHSERREGHNESSDMVQRKAKRALEAQLKVMICIGETLEERQKGKTKDKVASQIRESMASNFPVDQLSLAYEPIWAIGSGLVPSLAEIKEITSFIRDELLTKFGKSGSIIPITYGGSVNQDNAPKLSTITNLNGFLVGGASLKAESFLNITKAFAARG